MANPDLTKTGFLHARLAATAAIPPERRSYDAAVFVEYCQLQQEVLEALERRGGGGPLQCLEALKLARAEYISLGSPLDYSTQLHNYVTEQVYGLAGNVDVGHKILALLKPDTRLLTWATLVAGLQIIFCTRGVPGLLSMSNAAVGLLQQPSVRRRLERKLAAVQQGLPRPLLTYDQMLAFFAAFEAFLMRPEGGARDPVLLGLPPGGLMAGRLAVELLPKLARDSPRFLVDAAGAALFSQQLRNIYPVVHDALRAAEEQGSNYYVAYCGYRLADAALLSLFASRAPEDLEDYPPSALLAWLQQAEAAHRKCKGLLPHKWTVDLDMQKALALPAKPWLQRLQQEGDRWRPPLPEMEAGFIEVASQRLDAVRESPFCELECDGCGRTAAQLRKCGSCKEAQYCR